MNNHIQHIILVSIDTLRADCINSSPRAQNYFSTYETDFIPNTNSLDQILNQSIYYNNCISAAPYTSASHAAYFTGMWPLHNGIYEFYNRKLKSPTIFEYAHKHGYKTIFQTDFPVILGNNLGFTKSIDHYFSENEDEAFELLSKNKNNKTLSFFHFGGVHYPYGFHTLKFGGNDYIKKIELLEKKYNISNRKNTEPVDILDEANRDKADTNLLLRYKYIIQKLYKQKQYTDLFQLYLEGIDYFFKNRFDNFINKVKKFADNHNSVLFIFSDHGEEWSDESEGHHNTLSQDVIRIPFMVYNKHISPRIENRLIRTIDMAPTIISMLTNSKISNKLDGQNLNIFNSKTNKSYKNYGISQVWTSVASKKEISSYQSSKQAGKKMQPLKTYLSGESIQTDNDKFLRYYDKQGSTTKIYSKGNVASLKKTLSKYNKSINGNTISEIDIKQQIRDELNSLGYRV